MSGYSQKRSTFFLIRPELSPARREEFPVPVFREMAPYPLIYLQKSRNSAHFLRQNWQTSLYFPDGQGTGVRDGFADDCPHRHNLQFYQVVGQRRYFRLGRRKVTLSGGLQTDCKRNHC